MYNPSYSLHHNIQILDMEMAVYEKEASVRPNGVGDLRIREQFDRNDRLCFK
jgi:hypothetical protein